MGILSDMCDQGNRIVVNKPGIVPATVQVAFDVICLTKDDSSVTDDLLDSARAVIRQYLSQPEPTTPA